MISLAEGTYQKWVALRWSTRKKKEKVHVNKYWIGWISIEWMAKIYQVRKRLFPLITRLIKMDSEGKKNQHLQNCIKRSIKLRQITWDWHIGRTMQYADTCQNIINNLCTKISEKKEWLFSKTHLDSLSLMPI